MRRAALLALLAAAAATGCGRPGSVELVARLVEVPPGAIREDPLYNYAAILKYEVVRRDRGPEVEPVIYVAHYNPRKPRARAADRFITGVGGTLKTFRAGDLHRLCLEPDAEKWYVGGVINFYLGAADTIYWAVRTDAVPEPPAGRRP